MRSHGEAVSTTDRVWDVIVSGAGPAGIVAALASARQGMRTLLVEQLSSVGGMAGTGLGLLGFHDNSGNRVIGGPPWEIVEELMDRGRAVLRAWTGPKDGEWYEARTLRINPEAFKSAVTQMLEDAGVEMLFRTTVVDVETSDSGIDALVLENKSGRQLVQGRCFVDCTGDGDVVARAGGTFELGRRGDGITQPMTLIFSLVNVDLTQTLDAGQASLGPWKVIAPEGSRSKSRSVQLDLSPWSELVGELLPSTKGTVPRMWVHDDGEGVYYTGNFAHIGHLDGANGAQLSAGEIAGRKFVWNFVEFLREHVPGFSSSQLASVATHIGVRETRRIKGEFWLTYAEAVEGMQFRDSIAQAGNMFDVHNPTQGNFEKLAKGSQIKDARSFGLPYGMLVPRNTNNLLMAGRCVSGDREAQSSFRVMGTCMAMGHAAGVAAALSIRNQVSPSNVNVEELRSVLKSEGAIVDASDAIASDL